MLAFFTSYFMFSFCLLSTFLPMEHCCLDCRHFSCELSVELIKVCTIFHVCNLRLLIAILGFFSLYTAWCTCAPILKQNKTKRNNIASAHTHTLCLFISRFRSKQPFPTNTELDKAQKRCEKRISNAIIYEPLFFIFFSPIEDRLLFIMLVTAQWFSNAKFLPDKHNTHAYTFLKCWRHHENELLPLIHQKEEKKRLNQPHLFMFRQLPLHTKNNNNNNNK